MTTTLFVCTTCKAGTTPENDADRPGAKLMAAITAEGVPDGVTITPVSCLSACSNGCAVALSGTGKWSYVYGRMTPADAPDILAGAAAYAQTSDGVVPWRERPEQFRKQSLGRIPPFPPILEAAE